MCMCEKASSFHVCLVFDFLDLMSHGKRVNNLCVHLKKTVPQIISSPGGSGL